LIIDLSPNMAQRQRRRAQYPSSGLGQLLAAIALLLQIAIPGLHTPELLRLAAGVGDLAAAFDEHALCLARGSNEIDEPDKKSPKPAHHPSGVCCFCHGGPGLTTAPAMRLEPLAFVATRIAFYPSRQFSPRRFTGAGNPRAPPVRA
jgi:hypothetical protein